MDRKGQKDSFCDLCSLQFGKKFIYDIHMSVIHGQTNNKQKEEQSPNLSSEVQKEGFECLNEDIECLNDVRKTTVVDELGLDDIGLKFRVKEENKFVKDDNKKTTIFDEQDLDEIVADVKYENEFENSNSDKTKVTEDLDSEIHQKNARSYSEIRESSNDEHCLIESTIKEEYNFIVSTSDKSRVSKVYEIVEVF